MTKNSGWIGFDLDGTLAHSEPGNRKLGTHHIGEPVAPMVELAKDYYAKGYEVRIVTARAIYGRPMEVIIEGWCLQHLGFIPKVTDRKDFGMLKLYDDRAVQVEENTGRLIGQ